MQYISWVCLHNDIKMRLELDHSAILKISDIIETIGILHSMQTKALDYIKDPQVCQNPSELQHIFLKPLRKHVHAILSDFFTAVKTIIFI